MVEIDGGGVLRVRPDRAAAGRRPDRADWWTTSRQPLPPEDWPTKSTCNAFDPTQILRAW